VNVPLIFQLNSLRLFASLKLYRENRTARA
jgi:hypothetical protein